ncbi:hypothetical protein K502DRAFT_363734 [Neoconidiobolus thromboides FSU 785]|nr:hypothetical protein K502DRAFT_363734 [Neoconidiobolus thromboides FSU 785]
MKVSEIFINTYFIALEVLFFILYVTGSDICRRCTSKTGQCLIDQDCLNACGFNERSTRWGLNGDCDWGRCCCGADC